MLERAVEFKFDGIHGFHQLCEPLLVLFDMLLEMRLKITPALVSLALETKYAAILALRHHVTLKVRRGGQHVTANVPTRHQIMDRSQMVVVLFVVYTNLAHLTYGEEGTYCGMCRSIDDSMKATTPTHGEPIITSLLKVTVQLILRALEGTAPVFVKARIVGALVEGHVRKVLGIGVVPA